MSTSYDQCMKPVHNINIAKEYTTNEYYRIDSADAEDWLLAHLLAANVRYQGAEAGYLEGTTTAAEALERLCAAVDLLLTPGIPNYRGVYSTEAAYDSGDVVFWMGSWYRCCRTTAAGSPIPGTGDEAEEEATDAVWADYVPAGTRTRIITDGTPYATVAKYIRGGDWCVLQTEVQQDCYSYCPLVQDREGDYLFRDFETGTGYRCSATGWTTV